MVCGVTTKKSCCVDDAIAINISLIYDEYKYIHTGTYTTREDTRYTLYIDMMTS